MKCEKFVPFKMSPKKCVNCGLPRLAHKQWRQLGPEHDQYIDKQSTRACSQVPAEVPIAGKGAVKSQAAPPIKGFQGGTHYEFDLLLQRAAGMVQ